MPMVKRGERWLIFTVPIYVLCYKCQMKTRRIKYVYITGTKGARHAACDWYWLAVQAARWAELRRFNMRGRGLCLFFFFYTSQQKPQRRCCLMASGQILVMCSACLSGTPTSVPRHRITAVYIEYIVLSSSVNIINRLVRFTHCE